MKVLLIPGILCWTDPENYWESDAWDEALRLFDKFCNLKIDLLICHPGSLSSYHDQACEIVAELWGERVDFGQLHSQECAHERWGRDFSKQPALLSDWGPQNPIVILTHSSGANIARKLVSLLDEDFWSRGTSACWVQSIVCICANYNGSTLCGYLNIDKNSEVDVPLPCPYPKSKYLEALKKIINIYDWLQSRSKSNYINMNSSSSNSSHNNNNTGIKFDSQIGFWHLQHWGITNVNSSDKNKESIKQMVREIKSSNLFTNCDHLFFDITLQGCKKLNQQLYGASCFNKINLVSLTCQITNLNRLVKIRPQVNPSLVIPTGHMLFSKISNYVNFANFMSTENWNQICRKLDNCSSDKIKHKFSIPNGQNNDQSSSASSTVEDNDEQDKMSNEWLENDGLVPVASQKFPLSLILENDLSVFNALFEQRISRLPEELIINIAQFLQERIKRPSHEIAPFTERNNLKPGIWYYESVKKLIGSKRSWDHFDVVFGRPLLKSSVLIQPFNNKVKLFVSILYIFSTFQHN